MKPTGQSQLQKDFPTTEDIMMIAKKIISPAGCAGCIVPVLRKMNRLIKELIGRNPSTPGGLL
jgi:hypothetical protein